MVTVAHVLSVLQTAKEALTVLASLMLTAYLFPQQATLQSDAQFNYIIVGGGAAGSIMANRLSANPNYKVLLIEAGGDAPLESGLPVLNAYLTQSAYDWNYTPVKDNYSNYHINGSFYFPSGKMLGGSSAMLLNFHAASDPADYDAWAELLGDESWNYDSFSYYLRKSENVQDEEILASPTGCTRGVDGPIALTRQIHEQSQNYLSAFKEMGENIFLEKSGYNSLGYFQPLYEIDIFDNVTNPGRSYLSPCTDRTNLYVLKNTQVTKVNFDANNNAVSVNAVSSEGTEYVFTATNEIILSAGAFGTPHLLMLSGIGPKSHLESFNIDVIQDLPVGQSLQDFYGVIMVHKMEESNATVPASSPYKATPCTIGFASANKTQTYPDYLVENWVLSHGASDIIGYCTVLLGLNATICQDYLDAQTTNNILMSLLANVVPKSRGKVLLNSADPFEAPLVHTGYFTDPADMDILVKSIEDYVRVINTTYFKSVNAEFIKPQLTECEDFTFGTTEYWHCYVENMLITIFKYVASCPMGKVVDSDLLVKGVQKLRIVDASVFPSATRGYPMPTVAAIAEKAADTILQQYSTLQPRSALLRALAESSS